MENIIVGRNPVLEALKAGQKIEKIFMLHGQKGAVLQKIFSAAREANVTIETIDQQRFTQISNAKTAQGIAALIAEYRYREISEILAIARNRHEQPFIVLLDGIEDPHNLGAIIRSAECAGAHGVIIPKHRAVGLTESVIKASAGALAHIAVAKITNLVQGMDELKQAGCWIAGASGEAEQDIYQADFSGALGVVIGSEGRGLRRLVQQKCDFLIRIPMRGNIASLNASVAAGIIFFEIARQRSLKSG
ncbi:23S rRNA (guanosine(2251)-2'-O)-methyltransferase RlmB [candidate division KSB1 bacterium]|nr:23S rRNA (guanosine(2251)-2'-O)-methyltransferase RlmB [candidate division KSB1 bacterium]